MPYDSQGRWIPDPDGAKWQDDWETDEVQEYIRGQGFSSINDMYDTDAWRDMNPRQQVEVLKIYQDKYHGTKHSPAWQEDFKNEANWGFDLDRKNWDDAEPYDEDEYDYQALFNASIGGQIDFANYNNDPLWRATVDDLYASKNFPEFKDYKTSFTNARQLRAAAHTKSQWVTDSEKTAQKEWAKINAMPYTAEEQSAQEDFQKYNPTRFFDKATRTTYFLERGDHREMPIKVEEAKQNGRYSTLMEPKAPQFLNIVKGSAPQEEYHADGTRMVTDDDVKMIYQRYLGRDYRLDAEDVDHSGDGPKGIKQSEIDYWKQSVEDNSWSYNDFENEIKNHPDAARHIDRGRIFFNPNEGKEAQIRSKLTAEPKEITPPNLTIREIGPVKRPDYVDSNWKLKGDVV